MASTLATRQGILTRAGNRLSSILKEAEDLLALDRSTEQAVWKEQAKDMQKRIRKVKTAIETEADKVEDALAKYSSAVDSLDENMPKLTEVLQRTEEHSQAAQEVLDKAHAAITTLQNLQVETEEFSGNEASTLADITEMKLAPIPIPKFKGDIWEWETFWRSFDHSVHSRNIDELHKLNYLLEALQGEARESVKQFQTSGSTYPLVIAHLKEKYGDTQALIDRLLSKLQSTKARSDRLEDQGWLCEQLQSIISQLELKGEHINNTFLQKQLLAKFAVDIQRQILRQKAALETEGRWNTTNLLKSAKDYIAAELKIISQTERRTQVENGILRSINAHDKRSFKESPKFQPRPCFYCGKPGHQARNCNEVSSLEQRLQVIRMQKLCQNCGEKDHMATKCPKGACRICGITGHHTSICKKLFSSQESPHGPHQGKTSKKTSTKSPTQAKPTSATVNTVTSDRKMDEDNKSNMVLHVSNTKDIFLLAGQAQVLNPFTQALEPVHVMLDTGADRSFISNELAQRLRLQDIDSKRLTITTFGSQTPMVKTCGVTVLQLWDANGAPHSFTVTRIDTVTKSLQRKRLCIEDKLFICDNNLQLSISPGTTDIRPQILLGCADLFSLLSSGLTPQHVLPSGLQLIPSKLGYLVAGRNECSSNDCGSDQTTTVNTVNVTECHEGGQSWEDFCTFESSGVEEFEGPTAEERRRTDAAVWTEFQRTVERKEDGYYVRFPWRKEAAQLPDNKSIAVCRLQSLATKLKANPEILQQYQETIESQLQQGIIEEVNEEATPDGEILHYLPHRAVITPNKNTTKLRIVFDASAHLKDSPSLNDVLYRGPVMLPKLCDILLRFRIGKVAMASDVEKAFLQVRIHLQDRDATRFLWLRDPRQPMTSSNLVIYRFTRVTFGLICSPFLLAATIKYHMEHYGENPHIAREIDKNTYVDNVVLTTESTMDALKLYRDSKALFQSMSMNLREFVSNDEELKKGINGNDLSSKSSQKILGILWESEGDKLVLRCKYPLRDKITKRTISEQVASVYDPLGWLTPLTLPGKRFLQQLWKDKYDWDTILSQRHQVQWNEIIQKADEFLCRIERKITQIGDSAKLVVFSDASSSGMATCAYITTDSESHLVAGKSKLPSVKKSPTIPKMELNALTMAMRLAFSLYEAMKDRLAITKIVVLSDSEIALSWTESQKSDQSAGVLVRNRIREIRKLVANLPLPVHFGYVRTTENPADCATRGLAKEEIEGHLWWTGPTYIRKPMEEWPEECKLFRLTNAEEENTHVSNMVSAEAQEELLDWRRQRSLLFSQNVVGYVLRFIKKLLNRVNTELRERVMKNIPQIRSAETLPYITAKEKEAALRVIIRNHQRVHLPTAKQLALKQLRIREDEDGLLRCQGRLGNASLQTDTRHPYLIASKTNLAQLIVKHAHTPLHCGTGHTMANVRERVWIPKLRQMVRTIIARCVPCQKLNNLPYRYPEMDDLPERRVRRSRPFEHIGIDYFGPLSVKRGEEPAKAYGIILTCATTRLVHLELVPDMSTNHLLLALRRFFARRGIPKSVTSDNGPNFLLGEQILRAAVLPVVNDDSLANAVAARGIVWRTITPYAPWQGALYERLIKSIKHSLYKVIQRSIPSQETMETLLTEIEGSVNSRPLTYQEERWEDAPMLRPIDFIQRDMLITYPFEAIETEEKNDSYVPASEAIALQSRKQAEDALKTSHQFTERFWNIWSQQYLTNLREAHKLNISTKRGTNKQPSEGTVVLIADPVLPRNTWKMGRITKLRPSHNDVVREVELRLANGRNVRRPVNLLVPLELSDSTRQEETHSENTPTSTVAHRETSNDGETTQCTRYNLRPRPHRSGSVPTTVSVVKSAVTTALLLMTLAVLPSTITAESLMKATEAKGEIRCIPGGVQLHLQNVQRFELCAEDHCQLRENPGSNETILFPPEVTLHPHRVQWKFSDGHRLTVLDTICEAISFCENVRCWFCTAHIFNPECSPHTAIATMAILLYIAIAVMYLLCYVPVVLGKPIRLMCKILWYCLRGIARIVRKLWINRRNARRHQQGNIDALLRAPLIASFIACSIVTAYACHNIDVFPQETTICEFSSNGTKQCTYETTEIVKLNSFQKTACIRLLNNQSLFKELRLQWKQLRLSCIKEDILFTRNTIQRVVDSKRCAHMGSCVDQKCGSINVSSKIPELHQGNEYPGITRCIESCGGPGCGCFYPSSGCLFYRVFSVPLDERIYEVFRCHQWDEFFEVEITSITDYGRKIKRRVIHLKPTIPIRVDNMIISLNTLTMPPTPELSSTFITDGSQIAMWNHGNSPTLICDSKEAARTLNCSLQSNCLCEPAEAKVNCLCSNLNITSVFESEVENRLPIRRPWLNFYVAKDDPSTVAATVPSLVTAELLVHLKDRFDKTVTKVTESVCKVNNAILQGCYSCPQGAIASITCFTNGEPTIASIRCHDHIFTTPCHHEGTSSTIIYSSEKARVHQECEVSCGTTITKFELTGVLQWTRTIHGTTKRIVNGESNVYDEIVLPDFLHIFDVMVTWYKTILIVAACLIIAIVISYIFFWTFGSRILMGGAKLLCRVIRGGTRLCLCIVCSPMKAVLRAWKERSLAKKRL